MVEGTQRGLLDTGVLVDIENVDSGLLPDQMLITAVSLAELAAGPHAANDPDERARRQDHLRRTETPFESLPFNVAAARAYGRVYSVELSADRKARGARTVDLLIAAIALAQGLPLYTRNPADFRNLADIIAMSSRWSAGRPIPVSTSGSLAPHTRGPVSDASRGCCLHPEYTVRTGSDRLSTNVSKR